MNAPSPGPRARTGIRALALVGSGARRDQPADEWSDLDLVLVAVDPQAWLAEFGEAWFTFLERVPDGNPIDMVFEPCAIKCSI